MTQKALCDFSCLFVAIAFAAIVGTILVIRLSFDFTGVDLFAARGDAFSGPLNA
jgi:hypothetical protein